ncbi:glycoside hydrolase family 13 protein [Fulvivirga ligni]|uniref:glycoside hydrolase family 13 protein n=1 Tax=Fulvivirga ligni TaxID=2904246 RepID=UPI001F1F90C2|nr:alpha-glucosidase [Fulvivirga ligni]UII19178.1 alpha-glucosidase [Fulvivirga ligni]
MKKLLLLFFGFTLIMSCSPKKESNPDKDMDTTAVATDSDKKWWKEGIVYQIYPRSFKDTDGDGVGDLKGIIQKLDYIKSLGVDMVWLNPIYASPNDDNGYDISDYRAIMNEFGTMADFDTMLQGMHDRDIKLVMDLVVNHSSDEHEWFKQSRSSRDNPYRDYYHWWPAEKGTPTPRWSFFDVNSDAWLYDSLTEAYYLHYFSRKQPDLNWENPKVRNEVYDIMKFWLDKGIDGFRLDAFQFASKDTLFPEFPKGYEKDIIKYYGMGPHLHEYLQEMNKEVISKYDIMTVAEGAGSTFQDAIDLVAPDRHELNMVYHFEGMDVGNSLDGYDLKDFKKVYTSWDSVLQNNGWNSIFLANHDVPRMVSKFGNDSPEFRAASSKMLTTFIMSMRGTPYYYYGDELGMTNIDFNDIKQYKDISAINSYAAAKERGDDMNMFMKKLNFLSRDNARTPMQWNASENAGFTRGTPWLAVNPNYTTINVDAEDKDPNSCLNYFRKMTQLRKSNPILIYGDYKLLYPDNEQVYAYERSLDGEAVLVLLNFSDQGATLNLPYEIDAQNIMINNMADLNLSGNELTLEPYQAVIVRK